MIPHLLVVAASAVVFVGCLLFIAFQVGRVIGKADAHQLYNRVGDL